MNDSTERYFSGGKLNTDYIDSRADQIAKQFAELDRDTLAKLLALRMVEHEIRDELDDMRSETDSLKSKIRLAEHDQETHNLKKNEERHKAINEALYREFRHYAEDSKELFPKVEKHSKAQAARRKNKPGSDSADDPGRNDHIKAFHDRIKSTGAHDYVKQTAQKFGLSERQVRRIVKGK